MEVLLGAPIPVFVPEMNEYNSRWGVYSLPRMWREKNGELVIRINGEADLTDPELVFSAPNVWFVSRDEGKTWQEDPDGERHYDLEVVMGIGNVYTALADGSLLYQKVLPDRAPIENTPVLGEYEYPNHSARMRIYRYDDVPPEAKGAGLGRLSPDGTETLAPYAFDFPRRRVSVPYMGETDSGFTPIPEYLYSFMFKNGYLNSLAQLPDGSLGALAVGQHPAVTDRFCTDVYFLVSEDQGNTWKYRGTVASDPAMPYGYGGDGGEVSLSMDSQGGLYCVMRMDLSLNPDTDPIKCWGMQFSASFDGGFTWSIPKEIADSSITPQICVLDGNVLLTVYGRPGVHGKISTDRGETWSESFSILGKTLSQERAAGRKDSDSKYFDSCSYSNSFIEKIAPDTVLVCYTDQSKRDANGRQIKATMVRTVTVKK